MDSFPGRFAFFMEGRAMRAMHLLPCTVSLSALLKMSKCCGYESSEPVLLHGRLATFFLILPCSNIRQEARESDKAITCAVKEV